MGGIGRIRVRTAAIIAGAAVAGTLAGGAIAQEDAQEDETSGKSPEELVSQAREAEAEIDAMWQSAAEAAEAGNLKADVNQEEAARILSDAVDPPTDLEAAERLEAEMIELTEKLRESGDLPPLDGPSRLGDADASEGGQR